jgi:glutathione synthase/RimK-type ligase-like ATP-grasp enzyme
MKHAGAEQDYRPDEGSHWSRAHEQDRCCSQEEEARQATRETEEVARAGAVANSRRWLTEEFRRIADELFEETDLLLAQKFLPTEFDWRVGVLAGEPLFVCQYRMAPGHWQIVKYRPDGSSREGGFRTFELGDAPPELIDIAVRAARPIGEGFYGVDIKQTDHGFIVMEVNDNPNLEHGIEDQVGKDEIWTRLLKWFIERFEQ